MASDPHVNLDAQMTIPSGHFLLPPTIQPSGETPTATHVLPKWEISSSMPSSSEMTLLGGVRGVRGREGGREGAREGVRGG